MLEDAACCLCDESHTRQTEWEDTQTDRQRANAPTADFCALSIPQEKLYYLCVSLLLFSLTRPPLRTLLLSFSTASACVCVCLPWGCTPPSVLTPPLPSDPFMRSPPTRMLSSRTKHAAPPSAHTQRAPLLPRQCHFHVPAQPADTQCVLSIRHVSLEERHHVWSLTTRLQDCSTPIAPPLIDSAPCEIGSWRTVH